MPKISRRDMLIGTGSLAASVALGGWKEVQATEVTRANVENVEALARFSPTPPARS